MSVVGRVRAMDWGVVVGFAGLGVAVVSAVLAGLAVRQAKRANEIAENARAEAERANEIAAGANSLAEEANGIAVEANKLSEDANSIAQRAVDLETEPNDVAWDCNWEGPGLLRVSMSGDGEAHDVRVFVSVNGEDQSARRETVRVGEFVDLQFPGAGEELAAHRRREVGRGVSAVAAFIPDPSFFIRGEVRWRSPLGNERVQAL